jgi:tetratricopeptide (TPR) repeat protein
MHFITRTGVLFVLVLVCLGTAFGQGNTNSTGNGGVNSIRGRIYLPNGRTLDTPTKVELQSTTQPTQFVYTDSNGAFAFTGLSAGSYTIVVDAGGSFEIARESFLIDNEVQLTTVRVPPVPKNLSSPIYLVAKRAETLRNEVLNAKWSEIPKEATQHFKKGYKLLQDGKDTEAEAEFRSAIAAAPNFAPAYTALGNLEIKNRKFEIAVETLKQAIRYDAEDFEANLTLGIAFFNLNKMKEAELFFVNAAYLNSFSMMPHYYLGLIFSARNEGEVAQKAFEKVKELDGGKSYPIIHKYLGRIYLHKQMNKEAVAEFEIYLKLLPDAKDAEAIRKEISGIKTLPNATKYAPA